MRVAFIGLGRMGYPMAGHLASAGHELTVLDVEPAHVTNWLSEHRAQAAESPAEAARGAELIVSSLPADAQLLAVAEGPDGVLAAARPGTVWVDHTTASARVSRRVAEQADAAGIGFVDAPVSGGVDGARRGALAIMAGGEAAHLETARPVIDAYAALLIGGVALPLAGGVRSALRDHLGFASATR